MDLFKSLKKAIGKDDLKFSDLPRRIRRKYILDQRRKNKHPLHKHHFGTFSPLPKLRIRGGQVLLYSWQVEKLKAAKKLLRGAA